MYSLEEGVKLVVLARHAIETFLSSSPMDVSEYKIFGDKKRVVVSILKDGRIRSIMGIFEPEFAVYQAVVRAARDAAFRNPLAKPVERQELEQIEIHISILEEPRLVKVLNPNEYLERIHPLEEAVMIKAGLYKSIMLPHLIRQYDWNTERALRFLCMQVGLTIDAWRDLHHQIFAIHVQTFGEKEGRIVEF